MLGSTPEGADFMGLPFEGRRKKDYERALSYLHDLQGRVPTKAQVFLGGACDPTTWRKDVAIPMLEQAGVAFYNPQMPDWKPEMMQWEADAKVQSYVLLFIIDSQTRALATLNEAVEFILAGREVVLSMSEIQAGTDIAGQAVTEEEAKDINVARALLAQLAQDYDCAVCYTVEDAVQRCIHIMKSLQKDVAVAPAIPEPNLALT